VRAVSLNASPNQAWAAPRRRRRKEICGLVTALELFIAEDEAAEMKRYIDVCTYHRREALGHPACGVSSSTTR